MNRTCLINSRYWQLMLLWLALGSWLPGHAQATATGNALPTLVRTLQIVPPAQSISYSFWVDQTTSCSMSITSKVKNLDIRLMAPDATVFVFGQPNSVSFQSVISPDPQLVPDASGANYFLNLDNPATGQWALQIASLAPLSTLTSIPLQINFNNQVGPVLFGGGGSSTLGSNVSFGMAVVDGINKVGNLQTSATLFRLDDPTVPPVPVTFTDDGQGADYAAGDSIYSVYLTPSQVGSYMLQIEVSGDASTGHFQRSIASGFKIVPKTATMTGAFQERAIVGGPK